MKISQRSLCKVANVIAGQSPPSNFYNKDGEGLPFYQGKADFGDKYPIVRNWCTGEKHKEAIRNDILISVRAPVGPVNICHSRSIIGRGLSAIRVKAGNSYEYLYFYLKNHEQKIAKLGTGSTFKAITQSQISKIAIPFPENYDDQIRIATVLSRAEKLIAKRKESIKALDALLKSTFLEMFGDPVMNDKGWEKKKLKQVGQIITGNTPPRNDSDNYSSNLIEWIKTDNIVTNTTYLTVATEYLSEKGLAKARFVTSGALLIACIAGSIESIGRAAIADRKVSFNQQINAIQPNEKTSSLFLYWLFRISKLYIQSHATKGMKKILTKGNFENISTVCPPIQLQNKFAAIVQKVEGLKTRYTQSLTELENLYASLSQRAFKGELDLSKVPAGPAEAAVQLDPVNFSMQPLGEEVAVVRKYSRDALKNLVRATEGEAFSFDELWFKIEEVSFEATPEYETVKAAIYKMLSGESPQLVQFFDKDKKKMVMRQKK